MPDGEQTFSATVQAVGDRVSVALPFDVAGVWGAKPRHYITGTVNGHRIRGALAPDGAGFVLPLGPAWRRDNSVFPGDTVEVVIGPEGPQQGSISPDLAAALAAQPGALTFFEGLATFYRKGYVNWIEAAKRPETRARRIAEAVQLLREHRRER